MRTTRIFIALVGVAGLSVISSADFIFGSGRSFGMGGAGLAVPYDFQYSAHLNPAIYGLGDGSFKFNVPKVDLQLQGINYGDLSGVISGFSNGTASANGVTKLAQMFGGHESDLGLDANVGGTFNGFGVDVTGNGSLTGRPNQALMNYVNSGLNLNNIPDNANQYRYDGYGLGDYDVAVGYGRRVHAGPGNDGLSVGARVHFIQAYYSHYVVNTGAGLNNTAASANPDPTDMGNSTVLSKNGVAVDLGGVWSTGKKEGVFVGAVIQNFIEPNIDFGSVSPSMAQAASTGVPEAIDTTISPYQRTFNVGVGYMAKKNFVMAADLDDIFGGANRQLRAGAEWDFGPFQVRGGFASADGLTYGLGVGGFNLAFGPNIPATLSTALKF